MVNEIEHKKNRINHKLDVYKDILLNIAELSTSSRKKVACMTLHKTFYKIASFGYNGNYSGAPINPKFGTEEESDEPGKSGFVHAEINAMLKFREHDPENYFLLLTLSPCVDCSKAIINAGFKYVYWIEDYRCMNHLDIFKRSNIRFGNWDSLKSDYQSIINDSK